MDQELTLMFKALAAPARISMVRLLKERDLCVGALAKKLGITPGAVSQHLGILKEAGLVEAEKRGYFMHYRLNPKTLARWKENLEQFLAAPADLEPCIFIKQGGGTMCTCKTECQKPEELKGKPEECSLDQIKKCHGEVAEHPCLPSQKK
jgi:ArsR family transcriptional regulator, arsenate/arsenite/antimonite-responsive transcriptional repressor